MLAGLIYLLKEGLTNERCLGHSLSRGVLLSYIEGGRPHGADMKGNGEWHYRVL